MADYLLYHTNRTALGRDIVSLVDRYTSKQIPEDELVEWLAAWRNNCPNLMFEEGNQNQISPKLVRHIGKKRALLITTALRDAERE